MTDTEHGGPTTENRRPAEAARRPKPGPAVDGRAAVDERPWRSAAVCRAAYAGEIQSGAWAGPEEKGQKAFPHMTPAVWALPAATLADDGAGGAATWIWSDLHIGHTQVIAYGERPFANAKEMDDALFDAWAAAVAPGGRIINCGDAAMLGRVEPGAWERFAAAPAASRCSSRATTTWPRGARPKPGASTASAR